MKNWVWALNDKGLITKCYSPLDLRGKGRCNHIFFQEPGEGEGAFVKRVKQRNAEIRKKNRRDVQSKYQRIMISSKGAQDKWFDGHYFYKSDSEIMEGLHEELVSQFGNYTNLGCIQYQSCALFLDGKDSHMNGCASGNFLVDKNEVTLKTLLGIDGLQQVFQLDDIHQAFECMVSIVQKKTGLDIRKYLLQLITLDILTGNHDRHVENVTIWQDKKTKKFELALAFDHGCAFDNKIIGNDFEKPLSTFLKIGKPYDQQFYTRNEYASLIKRYGITLSVRGEIFDMLNNYQNELYDLYYVKHCTEFLKKSLLESEGMLWFRES